MDIHFTWLLFHTNSALNDSFSWPNQILRLVFSNDLDTRLSTNQGIFLQAQMVDKQPAFARIIL